MVRVAPAVREGVRSRRRYLTAVCMRVCHAALALAGEPGGIALDVLRFIINSADDLLPRSR